MSKEVDAARVIAQLRSQIADLSMGLAVATARAEQAEEKLEKAQSNDE